MRLRGLKYVVIALAALGLAWCGYLLTLRFAGNFHVVVENEIYRSAQPSRSQLGSYVRTHTIQTVVNLCELDQDADVDTEARQAHELGLTYLHFPLSKERLLTAREITQVIQAIQRAPKPVLVHSYYGADRAGLVAALYLVAIQKTPIAEAEKQLSPAFGHFAIMGTTAMDDTFRAAAAVYEAVDTHTPPASAVVNP